MGQYLVHPLVLVALVQRSSVSRALELRPELERANTSAVCRAETSLHRLIHRLIHRRSCRRLHRSRPRHLSSRQRLRSQATTRTGHRLISRHPRRGVLAVPRAPAARCAAAHPRFAYTARLGTCTRHMHDEPRRTPVRLRSSSRPKGQKDLIESRGSRRAGSQCHSSAPDGGLMMGLATPAEGGEGGEAAAGVWCL